MELPSAPSSSPPDPTVPQSPLPFWEFLRSALFWLAFVVIIIFALYQYFSANKALWGKLISIPFIRWISQSFKTLWRWMRGVNHQVAQMVRATLQQLRPASKQLAQQIQQYMRQAGMLSARDRVRFLYLSLVELGNKNGVVRDISQTPNQYRSNLSAAAPEAQNDIDILTDAFLEARYSNHPIDEPRVTPLQRAWENIRDSLTRPATPPIEKKD